MSYHTNSGSSVDTTTTTTVINEETGTVQTVTVSTGQGSSNVFAYYANEEGNDTYFPNFEELKAADTRAIPFSFVEIDVKKRYRIENTFSSEEGFALQLWYANSDNLDHAYGILSSESDYIRGEQVLRGSVVDIEPKGNFLFAGTFQHTLVGDPNPQGYELKGSITELEGVFEGPKVSPEDLFLVQHEGQLYNIPAADLKDYFAGLAKPENLKEDGTTSQSSTYGKPGIMYPGTGLKYDEISGKVDADIPARPRFMGLLSDSASIPPPFNRLSPDSEHPLNDVKMVSYPDGNEQEGDYYVVFDTAMTLTESWGFASGTRVYRGDSLIRVRSGDAPGDFEILPSIEGATSIQELLASQEAIDFDVSDIQYPQINIKTSVAAGSNEEFPQGFDGLLSKEDKNIINRLPIDYTEQDYTKYPPIE